MKFSYLLPTLFIFILFGCSKEDEGLKTTATSQAITLITPANNAEVNPCCTNFSWQSTLPGTFRLEISEDQNFNTHVTDSILTTNSFQLNTNLTLTKKYFWRVSDNTNQSSSSFIVKDVISGLKPLYTNIKIRRYDWNTIHGIWRDTTFYDSVKLTKENDKVRFEYTADNINQLMSLTPSLLKNTISYHSYNNSRGCDFHINYLTDSITVRNEQGGLGGGTVWQLALKK